MPPSIELREKKIFYFREQPFEQVKLALNNLFAEEVNIRRVNSEMADRICYYVRLLREVANRSASDNLLDIIDKELLRFLSLDLMGAFLADPSVIGTRSDLLMQILMVGAASDNLLETDIKPYTLNELKAAMAGSAGAYDDIVFLYTLRKLLTATDNDEYPAMLLNSLPAVGEQPKLYSWDSAFLIAMILQVVWPAFALLPTSYQEFLLQNYFYTAIVLGVPVRMHIKNILDATEDMAAQKKLRNFIFKALEKNVEKVPTDPDWTAERPFIEIFKEYMSTAYQQKIAALALEDFVNKIYRRKDGYEPYSAWLREALTSAFNLRGNI